MRRRFSSAANITHLVLEDEIELRGAADKIENGTRCAATIA